MSTVKFRYCSAGYCNAPEFLAIKGGRFKEIRFYATFGIIKHPTEGVILFDTGYSHRFFEATKKYPERLYAKITKVFLEKQEEAVEQLKALGIAAGDVKKIILSHFHADHTAGLRDFPEAVIYCSEVAAAKALPLRGFGAVSKGVLPQLHPDDIKTRLRIIGKDVGVVHTDAHWGEVIDLFGDGSIKLVHVPGHAAGMIGALLRTHKGTVFLIADAAWVRKSWQEFVLPNRLAGLIFDSWRDFKTSLRKVHEYAMANPETVIIATHCRETMEAVFKSQEGDAF